MTSGPIASASLINSPRPSEQWWEAAANPSASSSNSKLPMVVRTSVPSTHPSKKNKILRKDESGTRWDKALYSTKIYHFRISELSQTSHARSGQHVEVWGLGWCTSKTLRVPKSEAKKWLLYVVLCCYNCDPLSNVSYLSRCVIIYIMLLYIVVILLLLYAGENVGMWITQCCFFSRWDRNSEPFLLILQHRNNRFMSIPRFPAVLAGKDQDGHSIAQKWLRGWWPSYTVQDQDQSTALMVKRCFRWRRPSRGKTVVTLHICGGGSLFFCWGGFGVCVITFFGLRCQERFSDTLQHFLAVASKTFLIRCDIFLQELPRRSWYFQNMSQCIAKCLGWLKKARIKTWSWQKLLRN